MAKYQIIVGEFSLSVPPRILNFAEEEAIHRFCELLQPVQTFLATFLRRGVVARATHVADWKMSILRLRNTFLSFDGYDDLSESINAIVNGFEELLDTFPLEIVPADERNVPSPPPPFEEVGLWTSKLRDFVTRLNSTKVILTNLCDLDPRDFEGLPDDELMCTLHYPRGIEDSMKHILSNIFFRHIHFAS